MKYIFLFLQLLRLSIPNEYYFLNQLFNLSRNKFTYFIIDFLHHQIRHTSYHVQVQKFHLLLITLKLLYFFQNLQIFLTIIIQLIFNFKSFLLCYLHIHQSFLPLFSFIEAYHSYFIKNWYSYFFSFFQHFNVLVLPFLIINPLL